MQIVLRVLISSSLDLDESEQLVLTQKLGLGYGSQPPLYTWIQFMFFKTFGLSVFALSLFKNILLFLTYLFTYLNARLITRQYAPAVAAAATLAFIPQIVWESQRDLTHSVLASMMVCVTLFCFLRLRDKPSTLGYVLFGLCAGLGVLSKYNFALILVALAIAAVSIPEFRAIILNKRIVLAGVIAIVIVLPNAMWAMEHRDLALRSSSKFAIQDSSHWLRAISMGLERLGIASITFFGPVAVVYGILFWRRSGAAPTEKSYYATLLLRMLLISYGLMVLTIVVFRISDVHDRWLQPVLVSAPVLLVAWVQPRLDMARLKWLLAIAGVAAVIVTVGLHARIILAEKWHRTQPWNRPYDALAQQMKSALAPASVVMTDTTLLAGNLRMNMPDKIFTPPELAPLFTDSTANVAIAWDAGGDAIAKKTRNQTRDWPPPENLADFAQHAGASLDPAQAQYFSATFKFHTSRQMKVGVVMLNKYSGKMISP